MTAAEKDAMKEIIQRLLVTADGLRGDAEYLRATVEELQELQETYDEEAKAEALTTPNDRTAIVLRWDGEEGIAKLLYGPEVPFVRNDVSPESRGAMNPLSEVRMCVQAFNHGNGPGDALRYRLAGGAKIRVVKS